METIWSLVCARCSCLSPWLSGTVRIRHQDVTLGHGCSFKSTLRKHVTVNQSPVKTSRKLLSTHRLACLRSHTCIWAEHCCKQLWSYISSITRDLDGVGDYIDDLLIASPNIDDIIKHLILLPQHVSDNLTLISPDEHQLGKVKLNCLVWRSLMMSAGDKKYGWFDSAVILDQLIPEGLKSLAIVLDFEGKEARWLNASTLEWSPISVWD